ncbi:MAG: NAD(P)H dehydrogenase assembly family protein [Cyanobium sp.]
MDQPTNPEFSEQLPVFAVGDDVRLKARLRYLKTADPMPMLRPPDLVDPDELGQVVALKARNQLAVRFRRGTFLVEAGQLSR